jgi:hypothetical protein
MPTPAGPVEGDPVLVATVEGVADRWPFRGRVLTARAVIHGLIYCTDFRAKKRQNFVEPTLSSSPKYWREKMLK